MQWFKNFKIAQKLMTFIMLMVVALLIVGFVGYYFNAKSANSIEQLYKDKLVSIQNIAGFLNNLNANKANIYKLMLVTDVAMNNSLKEDIAKRRLENNEFLATYEKTSLDSFEKEQFSKIKELLPQLRASQDKAIALALVNKNTEAFNSFSKDEYITEQTRLAIREILKYNQETAEKLYKQNMQDATFATIFIVITILSITILAVFIGLMISNMISKPISKVVDNLKEISQGNLKVDKLSIDSTDETGILSESLNVTAKNLAELVLQVGKSVDEISAGAEEMTAAADQTAQGAQQSSSSVTQLAAGTQQIASGVTQLAKGAQEQSRLVGIGLSNINDINESAKSIAEGANNTVNISKTTEKDANEGHEQALNAVRKVNQLKVSATAISATINELGKLSSEIEMIVELIKGIAGQTNLLALNAAIEAARAGEHGKGFAVVAEEVKTLAGQSADATDKITQMIKEIQNKTNTAVISMDENVQEVEEGVVIIEDVGKSLNQILEAAKGTTKHIETISSEVDNLAKNSDQIVKMMENISAITEESSASAEEISAITEESAASAEEITSVIEEQTASIEEINASTQSLSKIAEMLQKQIAVFKV